LGKWNQVISLSMHLFDFSTFSIAFVIAEIILFHRLLYNVAGVDSEY